MSQLPREPAGLHHRPPSHAGHPQLGRRCPAPAHHPAPTGAPLTPGRGAAPRCPPPPLADARLPRQRRSAVPRPRGRSVCHPPDARLPARGPCSRAGRGGGGRRSPPARRGPGSGAPQRRRHQVSGTASRRPGRSGAAPRLPELPLSPSLPPLSPSRRGQSRSQGGNCRDGLNNGVRAERPRPARCAARRDLTAPGAGPTRGSVARPGRRHGPRRSRRAATRAGGGEEQSGTPPPASVRAPASRAALTGGGCRIPGRRGRRRRSAATPPWPAGGSEPAPHLPESLR